MFCKKIKNKKRTSLRIILIMTRKIKEINLHKKTSRITTKKRNIRT
jgi:hypothetical protein